MNNEKNNIQLKKLYYFVEINPGTLSNKTKNFEKNVLLKNGIKLSKSWQRKNYIEHQLAAVWQESCFLLLSPVITIGPVSIVSIAIRSVQTIAVVSIPGISIRGSSSISSRSSSGLSISRPLSVVVSIAIRSVVAIRPVSVTVVPIPGISRSLGRGGGLRCGLGGCKSHGQESASL